MWPFEDFSTRRVLTHHLMLVQRQRAPHTQHSLSFLFCRSTDSTFSSSAVLFVVPSDPRKGVSTQPARHPNTTSASTTPELVQRVFEHSKSHSACGPFIELEKLNWISSASGQPSHSLSELTFGLRRSGGHHYWLRGAQMRVWRRRRMRQSIVITRVVKET